MFANELFEEKQNLVFAAIKQHFGDYTKAKNIAEINNMELDDLIQVGQMILWNLCLKYDKEREETFSSYVVQSIKWGISKELHEKGLPIKINTNVSAAERNSLYFHSTDLYTQDGESENDYFVIDASNVEEEALLSVQLEEALSVLDKEEKYILIQKGYGFTDREISKVVGKSTPVVNRIKNAAFKKLNPNYEPRAV